MRRRCWQCGRFATIVEFWGNVVWWHGQTYHWINTGYRGV